MIDDPRSTILLIEDDPATRTFLADNLTADGYTIRVARGLREGVHELRTQFPDLVVLDVGLPDGSGLDLVRAVRRAD
ncbi:MAG: response regulator transcription factor, partial [Frankiales bacterium]|nr:response regulator transcription factor [Frankiales bacterium]